MYLSHFGLHKWPFKLTPDLSFFFRQASREAVVEAVQYAIARGDAVVKVSGAVGVGKTMLLRLLTQRLSGDYQIVYLSAPNLSPIDILRVICAELSVNLMGQENKADLLSRIQKALIERYQDGQRVVMLVDEAQALTPDALEEIRLLGNLETEWDKLLQVVLFGQPELDKTLEDPRIRPLKDRLACNVTLSPFTPKEVKEYLNYRMRIAGYLETDFFSDQAARKIHRVTGGLPRSINILADKLLMAASANGDKRLKNKHFRQAGAPVKQGAKVLAISLLAGLGVMASAYFVTTVPVADLLYGQQEEAPEKVAERPSEITDTASPAHTPSSVSDKPETTGSPVSSPASTDRTETDVAGTGVPSRGEEPSGNKETEVADAGSRVTNATESPVSGVEPEPELQTEAEAELGAEAETPKPAAERQARATERTGSDTEKSSDSDASGAPEPSLSPSNMGENYQAWSKTLGIESSKLLTLLTLHERLRNHISIASAQTPLILIAPAPVADFPGVYARMMDRLSWENREHVYALMKTDDTDGTDVTYQLVYDPRTSGKASLQRKAAQIKALSNAPQAQTVTVQSLRAIISEK
ncbi:ExeA family protein [Hydrogenovibrio halophilus]|uniref:ExeA family protein n=1 Tax=Hydrogenovibrio halophilus TaxID=373391 RepID=UPI000365682F|nr:AAA family ATPase [Hydrogenovibrio halophilus]